MRGSTSSAEESLQRWSSLMGSHSQSYCQPSSWKKSSSRSPVMRHLCAYVDAALHRKR